MAVCVWCELQACIMHACDCMCIVRAACLYACVHGVQLRLCECRDYAALASGDFRFCGGGGEGGG